MNSLKLLKNLTVLYVDDDPQTRESMASILSYYFNKVCVANNGVEALQQYKHQRFDVLLVDYDMPFMDGYEFIKAIREENTTIPAVIISSYDDKEKLFNAIKLDLVDYLVKPFEHHHLKALLREIIGWMERKSLLEITISDDLTYSFTTKKLISNTGKTSLTASEYKILEHLIVNENRFVSYQTLIDINGEDSTQKSLISQIYKIKKKLDVPVIKNVKNEGYIFSR